MAETLQEIRERYYKEYREEEYEFAELMKNRGHKIIWATEDQDIYEHWDLMVDGLKIDVKALKKLNRDDLIPDETIIWLELVGISGHPGWIYGQADVLAFELNEGWLLIRREKVANFVDATLAKGFVVTEKKIPYSIYKGHNKFDQLMLTYRNDIFDLGAKVITK